MSKFVFRKAGEPRTVSWPCKISVPIDGGRFEEQTVNATFRLLDPNTLAEEMRPSTLIGQNADVAVLRKVLVSVEGGDDLDDVLADPVAVLGMSRGYFDMVNGRLPKN